MLSCSPRWVKLIRRAADSGSLQDGLLLHDQLLRSGLASEASIAHSLIFLYAHLGSAQEAQSAFRHCPTPDLCSWNVLIHAYGRHGLLQNADDVFHAMPSRDVFSWTSMICLLARCGRGAEAVSLYDQMHVEGVQSTKFTLVAALDACTGERCGLHGQQIHVSVLEFGFSADVVVGTALINMYGECRKLHVAWNVFESMPDRDIIAWNSMIAVLGRAGDHNKATHTFWIAPVRDTVAWNTMIGSFLQGGNPKMALDMFHKMVKMGTQPNEITYKCVVNTCAALSSLEDGQLMHISVVKLGYESGELENSLISMYGKCKSINEARSIFNRMRVVDVVSWTAIIVACTENELGEEALGVFHEMQSFRFQVDEVVLLCCLDACAMLSALVEGENINDTIYKLGLEEHEMAITALITMYGKCGRLREAQCIFNQSSTSNVAVWNALMTSLAHSVCVVGVLNLLHEMWRHAIQPNSVTFSCVLTVCSHAGLIDIIIQLFLYMHFDYAVQLTEDHFLCMVDLFARVGQLVQAEILIKNFPFQHDEGLAWQCLVAAYQMHCGMEHALRVADCGLRISG